MAELGSLQARLAKALDALERRINADVLVQSVAPVAAPIDTDELDQLRTANQDLQSEDTKQKTAIMALERGLSELRAANASLIQASGEPENGDAALRAELAALRADRQAEQAEVAALLVALGPLVQEIDTDA